MRGGELSKGQLTARKENFHSSRFTARCSSHLCMPGRASRLFRMVSWPVALTGLFRLTPSPPRRPFAACLHHHPYFLPSRAFPLPWACGLPCSYLLGLPPSGSSFRRAVAAPGSPSPFVVKTVYILVNKSQWKMFTKNNKNSHTTKNKGTYITCPCVSIL